MHVIPSCPSKIEPKKVTKTSDDHNENHFQELSISKIKNLDTIVCA